MATILLVHDHFNETHLESVKREMLILGAPVIRAVENGEEWIALEGCHRIRAAKALGLVPVIEPVTDEEITLDDLGVELDSEEPESLAFDVARKIFETSRTYVKFPED